MSSTGPELPLLTERLWLRPMAEGDASLLRELWAERDPRTPPRRRIDAEGRPTVEDLTVQIRTRRHVEPFGLLAVERRVEGDVIGCCGLVDNGRVEAGEPELAFELLRRVWGRGYATEAASAVVDRAAAAGVARLWATVWEWNTASLRVLAKLGFVDTGRREVDPERGATLYLALDLSPAAGP